MIVQTCILAMVASTMSQYPTESMIQGDQQYQHEQNQQQPAFHKDFTFPEKPITKREAAATPNLAPQWGFIPLIAGSGFGFGVPPVIQVQHIVQIQSPNQRCLPIPSPPSTPRPMEGSKGEGIEGRFGETNDTATRSPSPCVWAIVSCCSPGNANIRYACFELLGCQGAFWDLSPCEPRVVQAAANTALMFYMSATPKDNQSNVIDFEAPETST